MSDFTDILTHGRRLQGAVKDLSIDELNAVTAKIQAIIEKRKEKEASLLRQQEEKREKAEEIKKQMEAAGLDINDLKAIADEPVKAKTGKKRPIKYRLTDDNGDVFEWTGIGRMPVVFKNALAAGKSLEDFSI